MLPLVVLEGAQQTRQAGAAIESFRNELVGGIIEATQIALDTPERYKNARLDHRGR